jgi:hypothetical protein
MANIDSGDEVADMRWVERTSEEADSPGRRIPVSSGGHGC